MTSRSETTSAEATPVRYRLVALDLDSTLQPDGTLHPADIIAIRTAHSLGAKVSLVSARPPRVAHRYWAQLGLGSPIIAFNGALVYDFPTQKPVAGQAIEPEDLVEILRIVADFDSGLGIGFESATSWATNRFGPVAEWRAKEIGQWPAEIGDLDAFLQKPVFQVWIDVDDDSMVQLEPKLSAIGLTLMRYTHPDRLLLRSRAASRGWALSTLAHDLGVESFEVMVVGGGGLERSLVQAAAFSVVTSAVSDLDNSIAVSENIAYSSGVAEAFKRFLVEDS
ncbi:MAG: HAD hydrolase family protein [Chloroflexota bacterium]|nr:HAD hydrolase family protein [Chloroflexota bacterium]